MVRTVEQSVRSILDQLDDRYEVIVVDGGPPVVVSVSSDD